MSRDLLFSVLIFEDLFGVSLATTPVGMRAYFWPPLGSLALGTNFCKVFLRAGTRNAFLFLSHFSRLEYPANRQNSYFILQHLTHSAFTIIFGAGPEMRLGSIWRIYPSSLLLSSNPMTPSIVTTTVELILVTGCHGKRFLATFVFHLPRVVLNAVVCSQWPCFFSPLLSKDASEDVLIDAVWALYSRTLLMATTNESRMSLIAASQSRRSLSS
jgi:hypothetical protein